MASDVYKADIGLGKEITGGNPYVRSFVVLNYFLNPLRDFVVVIGN